MTQNQSPTHAGSTVQHPPEVTLDIENAQHHPMLEKVTDLLVSVTGNPDKEFFRVMAVYYFSKIAGTMKAVINSPVSLDTIPVNVYAIAVAPSGFGKGYSTGLIENQLLKDFEQRYKEDTFPTVAENALWKRAIEKAVMSTKTEEQEKEALDKEFLRYGPVPFTFDSATPAAIRDIRNKLLLAEIGAINLQIDEIGKNFVGATDILPIFLELYDQGRIKTKLIRNTAENQRAEEYDGKTPPNALLFGTPHDLFDGDKVQENFMNFLEVGYARRSIFAWGEKSDQEPPTPAERFVRLSSHVKNQSFKALSLHFANLADVAKVGWEMTVTDDVVMAYLTYQYNCELEAANFKTIETSRRFEMEHRANKALKIAGCFAFIDESLDITMDHLMSAIKLVEESGRNFQRFLKIKEPYVMLAEHLAECDVEQTHADLCEALRFYPGSGPKRKEMMDLATAWGYKNNHIIKKSFMDGIEFFSGESLKDTDLSKMTISYSTHPAEGYLGEEVPFDCLHQLTSMQGYHWCAHHFQGEYRAKENVIPGFNMAVFDVDGTISIDIVQDLLRDYTHMIATTKNHTDECHRFRLIMPMSHHLALDEEEYREFMQHFLNWLPFPVDEQAAKDIARKWRTTNTSQHFYNEGMLISPLPFIPRTSRNEEYCASMKTVRSMDNLERWFASRMDVGSRSNEMIKYALALVSAGYSYMDVENRVLHFNSQLPNPLTTDELRSTILKTVAKRIHQAA